VESVHHPVPDVVFVNVHDTNYAHLFDEIVVGKKVQSFQEEVAQGKDPTQLQALYAERMLFNMIEYVLHVADGACVESPLMEFWPKGIKGILRILPVGSPVK